MGEERYRVLQRLDANENAILGVCAGVIEAIVTQPMTFTKNMLQQGIKLEWSMFPRRVYRGQISSCANDGTLTGLQFLLAGSFQQMITGGVDRRLSFVEEVGSGMASGFISGIPCCALELTMIQQQVHGGSTLATMQRTVRNHGSPLGMMRGFWPSAGRESFFAAGYLGVSPWLQGALRDVGVSDQAGAVVGALASGVLSAALTHPLDTIKSCMQGDTEGVKYGTVSQTARALYAEEQSLKPFFRGYGVRASMICLCFWVFNEAKLQLGPLIYPGRFT